MIHILYRHTSNESGIGKQRPAWFTYEKCLRNVLDTIEGNFNVRFHLLFDGSCTIADPRIDATVEFLGGSDLASFNFACEYAKSDLKLYNGDFIYFLENDYVHAPDWYDKFVDLVSSYEIEGYVSLYDHYDKYTAMYPELTTKLLVTKSSHWRSTPSTCGSFIVPYSTFIDDYDHIVGIEGDHGKFIWLGQNKNRIVLTPIPGLSTHCEIQWLSPTIDWNNYLS